MSYIDPSFKPMAEHCFMARFEILGARKMIALDVSRAALWICTLQAAAIDANAKALGVEIIPNPEGVYALAARREALEQWMRLLLDVVTDRLQAAKLLAEVEPFLVVGAYGEGRVVRGDTIPESASPVLMNHPEFRKRILIGALFDELKDLVALAPPLGVVLHTSVGGQGEASWWKWWPSNKPPSADVCKKIFAHLDVMGEGAEALLDKAAHDESVRRLRTYLNRSA
jgi:hypothetical protein